MPESEQPVQNRFNVKGGKKGKTEKRVHNQKKGATKYVPKNEQYQPDPNFVHVPQQESEEEVVQQQEQSA